MKKSLLSTMMIFVFAFVAFFTSDMSAAVLKDTKGKLDNNFSYIIRNTTLEPNIVVRYMIKYQDSFKASQKEMAVAYVTLHAAPIETLGLNKELMNDISTQLKFDRESLQGGSISLNSKNAGMGFTVNQAQLPMGLAFLHEINTKALLHDEAIEEGRKITQKKINEYLNFAIANRPSEIAKIQELLQLIEQVTAEEVREFYAEHYRLENMTVYLFGTMNPKVMLEFITAQFSW